MYEKIEENYGLFDSGVVVLDRMNIGHNDFEPEQLCGQIACDGSRIA